MSSSKKAEGQRQSQSTSRKRYKSRVKGSSKLAPRRRFTLYDAVAERIGASGFINAEDLHDLPEDGSQYAKRKSIRGVPVMPEEVLFRGANAPDRVEEDDFYAADRHLKAEEELPDSDLSKAIHAYASDFYYRATQNGDFHDFRSMNGSALLACGILLEEACKHALGKTGDLVFTEEEQEDIFTDRYHDSDSDSLKSNSRDHKRRKLTRSSQEPRPSSSSSNEERDSENSGSES